MKENKKEAIEEEAKEEEELKEEAEEQPAEEETAEEEVAETESAEAGAMESKDSGEKDKFGRTLYKVKCSECGRETEVPFKPSGDRPVYCRDCYQKHRPRRRF